MERLGKKWDTSYTSLGFDNFLNRGTGIKTAARTLFEVPDTNVTHQQLENRLFQVSADTNLSRVSSDGIHERVKVGQLGADDYGIRIKDANGSDILYVNNGNRLLKLEDKKEPTLLNNWTNFDAAETDFSRVYYYMDAFRIVHLVGMIKEGTWGQNLFIMPTGYRPLKSEIFNCACGSYVMVRVKVNVAGEVNVPNKPTGADTWISLSGISFRTD